MAIAAVILEFIDGPEKGRSVRISDFGPTLLGRGTDSDIRLPAVDSSLSRNQAYIELSRDCCVLTRVTGSNRVVEVNHRNVDLQCSLSDGDVVRLGVTVLRIALILVDTACLICDKAVEDGSSVNQDDHGDVSIQAHERCVDLIRSSHECFNEYEACQLVDDNLAGRLYQVYDRKTRRIWALKRLTDVSRPKHVESDVQRLLAIRHPNIIRCVQGDVDREGLPFLVMEFARGGNVEDFVGRGGYSPNVALQLVDDVLEALKFLHALGTAHGNLHPRSIVIQREVRGSGVRLRAKLVDLGITSGLRGETSEPGTLLWHSPEHRPGQHEERDDVYTAAAMLCFLLTRQLPSDLTAGTGDFPPGRSGFAEHSPLAAKRPPLLRPGVASVIDRACHKDPGKRFRSIQQLQDALHEGSNRR